MKRVQKTREKGSAQSSDQENSGSASKPLLQLALQLASKYQLPVSEVLAILSSNEAQEKCSGLRSLVTTEPRPDL